MWSLLNPRARVLLIVVASLGALLIWLLFDSYRAGPNWSPTWGSIALRGLSATGIVTLVGRALGNATWPWVILSRCGLTAWLFPDLSGKWTGEVTSNAGDDQSGAVHTPITVTIRQTWASLSVHVRSDNGYSESRTVFAYPAKDESEAMVWMIFRASTPAPKDTDEQTYLGASRLSYDQATNALRGVYWTNRGWFRDGGRNTAGTLLLRRMDSI